MAAPLLTRDARDLRMLARPRWQRRLLTWTVPFAAVALIGVHISAVAVPSDVGDGCSTGAPCTPDPVGAASIGLLVAAAVTGKIYPRLPAWLAAGFLATLVVSERLLRASPASPAWTYLCDVVFVVLCAVVGGVRRDRSHPAAERWIADAPRERPPPPPGGPPRQGAGWRLVAWMFAAVAVGCVSAGWYTQKEADARQQAASVVSAPVTGHPDGYTVEVDVRGRSTRVDVLDSGAYPLGTHLDLYVDGRGLRQPVAEPYDATGWVLVGVLLGGVAAACYFRGVETSYRPRRLFADAQPVSAVSALCGLGIVAVYAADARPGEPALAHFHTAVDEEDDDPDVGSGFRPATLYGVPVPGHWCAVVVDGQLLTPTRPVPTGRVTAPLYGQLPTGDEDDDLPMPQQPPLRPEELDALRPADRFAAPDQVLTHVRNPLVGYASAVGMPLVLTIASRALPDLPYTIWLFVAALALALSCAAAWRMFMRGRAAWNGHGIAVVGAINEDRAAWHTVKDIDHDGESVTIITENRGLVLSAGRFLGMAGHTERDAEQLAHALRYARDRAATASAEDPPKLERPRPSPGLYALWLIGTPLLAWLMDSLANH
jgi:hypothetical protein